MDGEVRIPLIQEPELQTPKKLNSSLYQLYGHSSLDRTKTDVVSFHGTAAGDYEDTWRTTWMTDPEVVDPTDTSQVCWPGTWLGVEYPQSRILAASYDSSAVRTSKLGRADMTLIAERLVSDLIVLGNVGTRPFVMVGHNLGCVVIKALIMHVVKAYRIDNLNAQTGYLAYKRQSFVNNVRGCFFYSPPSHGVDFSVWQDYFPRSAGPLMTDLKILNSNTERLNEEFRMWRHSQPQNGSSGLPVWAICERYTSIRRGLMNQEGVAVPEGSARLDVDHFVTVAANHMSICMPASKEHDSRFLLLLKFLNGVFEGRGQKPSSMIEGRAAYIDACRKKKAALQIGARVLFWIFVLIESALVVVLNVCEGQILRSHGNSYQDTIEAEEEIDEFQSRIWVVNGYIVIVYMLAWLGLLAYTFNLEPRGNPLASQDELPQFFHIARDPPRRDVQ